MRITSWNVNGLRAIEKKGFVDILKEDNADIFCVQETKAHPDQLSEEMLAPLGYHSYWSSAQKKGYSGTAIFSKEPLEVKTMNIDSIDNEGRVLIAEFHIGKKKCMLINAYFPNSQEGGKRLDYKLAFCKSMLEYCNTITMPLLFCGDYNIAHTEIDLARPKQNEASPGYLPEERAWMTAFIDAGYIDTFRTFNTEPHNYTWWSYRGGARERNVGWRLDYFCHNKQAHDFIKNCEIQDEIMGSDHCPVSVTLHC